MPTRIRVKTVNTPVELEEDIATVAGRLNESPPGDWVVFTRSDGKKIAFQPQDVTFVAEPRD